MKYVLGGLVIAATLGLTWLALPQQIIDDCCEYLGLLGPEGVSEVPGVEHAEIEEALADGAIPETVPGLKLHDRPEPFTLPDLQGNPVSVRFDAADFTVITWMSCLCPTSMIYEARLNALRKSFPNAQWFAINSSAMESVAELREHLARADKDRLALPVLKDEGNVLADAFGARVSTETFVFDREGRLQYRGAIDDARNPQRVRVRYIERVLTDLATGQTPPWRYQPAKGCCPIDRVKPESTMPVTAPATAEETP